MFAQISCGLGVVPFILHIILLLQSIFQENGFVGRRRT
jgi:hypothetical protein